MDFNNYTKQVIDFFEAKLPIYLDRLKTKYPGMTISNPSKYIEDYFDTETNKENIVLYITPDPEYSFEELSNESNAMRNDFDIFMTFRNDTEASLKSISKIYMEAFVDLISENRSLNKIVDYAFISQIKYFDGIEGSKNGKAFHLKLSVLKED